MRTAGSAAIRREAGTPATRVAEIDTRDNGSARVPHVSGAGLGRNVAARQERVIEARREIEAKDDTEGPPDRPRAGRLHARGRDGEGEQERHLGITLPREAFAEERRRVEREHDP